MCQLADWKTCSLKTDNSSDNSYTASLEYTVPASVWCSCNVSCCRAATFAFLHTQNNADMGLEPMHFFLQSLRVWPRDAYLA